MPSATFRTLTTITVFLLTVSASQGQKASESAPPAAAPVPPQILSAKRVFVANSSGNNDVRIAKYVGGPNGIYNQFYADLQASGRFELVSSPAESDLALDVTIVPFPIAPSYPGFRLSILDPKTNVLLWAITEPVDPAFLAKTARKNIATSLGHLADDLTKLSTGK